MQPRFITIPSLTMAHCDIVINLNRVSEVRKFTKRRDDGVFTTEYHVYVADNNPTKVAIDNHDCTALEHLFITEARIQSPATDVVTEDRRVEL